MKNKVADNEQKVMPSDYRPSKAMDYMPLDYDLRKGFAMLDDAQAGALVKRLFDYANDYAISYDDSLRVDTAGLSDMAVFVAEMAAGKIQRRADVYRKVSFNRSGANNGGRPKKDGS